MDQSPAVNIAETPPERLHAEQHIPGEVEARRLSTILEDILAELRRANTGSASSAVIESNSKGHNLAVKAYDQSPVPVDAALTEYGRLFREVERRSLAGWDETGEALS